MEQTTEPNENHENEILLQIIEDDQIAQKNPKESNNPPTR